MDVFPLLKRTAWKFLEDDCLSSGAAIAFYTVFSLPPLLTIAYLIATSFGFSEKHVHDLIQAELGMPIAADGGEADQPLIISSTSQSSEAPPKNFQPISILQRVVGFGLLLISATAVFGQLQYSLDKAWGVAPDPNQGGFRQFLVKRLLSVGLVAVIGFLLLVSLILTSTLDAFLQWAWHNYPIGQVVGQFLGEIISFATVTLLFAAMFKILPDAKIQWRDVWVGAVFTSLLFSIGKLLIGWYLEFAQIGRDWGTASVSVVAALVWVYYSSLIVLFGAELTQVWAHRHDRAAEPEEGAVRVKTSTHPLGTEN